ncbi:MAG TPA: hypothetical protein PLZ51_13075, partial [Aggregatilineales bacterium]|nr:hypothetical protein [Aggregatilineales bacterium]
VIFADQTVATYYWRGCARLNNIPCTTWSNVSEFTVQPMGSDILTAPVDGYTSHNSTIKFEIIQQNDNGISMDRRIQVALDSDFTDIVV